MKKRFLLILLTLTVLLSCISPFLTTFSFAASSDTVSNEEDEGNDTDVAYTEDIPVFSSTTTAPSSSASWKWNAITKGRFTAVTDPLGGSDKVALIAGARAATAVSVTLQKKYLDYAQDMLLSFDLLLSPGTSPANKTLEALDFVTPPEVRATLFGVQVLCMKQDSADSGMYAVSLVGGDTVIGYVAAGSWFRASATYDSAAGTLRVILYGDALTDATRASCTAIDSGTMKVTASNNAIFSFSLPMPAKSSDDDTTAYGMYIRDTRMVIPGDLYAVEASLEQYADDPARNLIRDGVLTLAFSHDIDPATVKTGTIRVYDEEGVERQISSLRQSTLEPSKLLLDFSSDPLPKYSTFTVEVSPDVLDLRGVSMTSESLFQFATLGDRGELRPKAEVVETPEGGFVMPDIYNTGYQCSRDELKPLLEKYPLLVSGGLVRDDGSVTITDSVAKEYGYLFENFYYEGSLKFTCKKPLTITNAYLNTPKHHYALSNGGPGHVTISYLEGEGSLSAFIQGSNMTLSHVYIHDVVSDHMKAGANTRVEYSYFCYGGTRSPGAHADIIQFSGSKNLVTDNIVIVGNRFDVPQLLWDHLSNSALFLKVEPGCMGYTNVQIVGNYINGGGYSTYLTIDSGGEDAAATTQYITYKDNINGYGEHYGPLLWGTTYFGNGGSKLADFGGEYSGNGRATTLAVGSVFLEDESGNRLTDLAKYDGGTLKLKANFANYMKVARTYQMRVRILAGDGSVLLETDASNEIRRYIPYDEYVTDDNIYNYEYEEGKTARRLIQLPDQPVNVTEELVLTGLPTNLAGCRAEVVVYDTTDAGQTEIRSETIIGSGTYQPALPIAGASLTLNARPQLNFYVDRTILGGLPSGATLHLMDDAGNFYDGIVSDDDYMTFSIADIPASSIGTEGEYRLAYTVAGSDAEPVQSSVTVRYSPLTYAIHMYGKAEAETALDCEDLRALLIAFVQYADAAGSTGAKERFATEAGYMWAEEGYGDYAAIRERNGATEVTWGEDADAISSVGALLSGSIDLYLTMRDTRYTLVSATIGGEALRVSRDGGTLTVGGLYASDLYGVITFVFSGENVPEVTATLTVAGFLDGYSGGENEALARATAIYMDAAWTFANVQ